VVLVGRDEALSDVDTALRAGRGEVVLVAGEPGIGKTALCLEVAARAEAAGFIVAWAGCWRTPPVPPLWPWRRIVREVLDTPDHGGVRGEYEPWLAHLDGGEPPVADPDAALAWLADTVVDVFDRARRPTIAVVDDLQWADVRSVQLLAAVSAQLSRTPAVVLAACRADELDPALLGPVSARARIVALGGLDRASLRRLAEELAGGASIDVDELYRHTGGNPLFVRELLRSGAGAGRLPPTVSAVLAERLNRLSGDARGALDAGAVVGDAFSIELLSSVLGTSSETVLDHLKGAVELGLIEPGPSYRFSHTMAREAVLAALDDPTLRDLHRAVARELESQRATGRHVDAAALAHHLAAVGGAHLPRAVDYTREAARAALRQFAARDAVRLLQATMGVLDASTHPKERLELLIDLGQAQHAAGDPVNARSTFEHAIALSRTLGEYRAWGRAALGYAGDEGFEVPALTNEQLAVLDEVLDALGDTETDLRARLLARQSIAAVFVATEERRLALAEAAVALARRADRTVLIDALAAHCDAIAGPEHVRRRLAQAAEIVELAQGAGDGRRELLGRRLRAVALLERGEVDSFDAEVDEFARVAALIRQPHYQWYVPLWRGARALMTGEFDAVERLLAETERIGAAAGSENAALLTRVQLWWLRTDQGRAADALVVLEGALGSSGVPPVGVQVSRAMALANAGRGEEARAVLDRVLPDLVADAPRDSEWLPMLAEATLAVHAIGGHHGQAWLYEQLLPYRELYVVEGIGACCLGSIERFLAMLAPDPAEHLAAARTADRRAGAVVALRRTEDLAAAHGVLRCDGDVWVVGWNGRERNIRDRKGLHDLAVLITRRGEEVHVLELVGGAGDIADTSGPQLDREAVSAYRMRIAQIDAELDDADSQGDAERSKALFEERQTVIAQLNSAFGLGGRPRPMGHSGAERARTAVAQRIRDTLRHLDSASPDLAAHLHGSIRTGTYCSYIPDEPVSWTL